MTKYVLYCSSCGVNRTPDELEKYADKMAQKIADKFKIKVVGIPVTDQCTNLERVDD